MGSLRVHSRRLQQIASVATSASPALDPAWGDLFKRTPGTGRSGGAEAPAWLFRRRLRINSQEAY